MADSGNKTDFKQFEVVAFEPKDHHYLKQNNTNGQASFQSIAMKEWKIMEHNLPDAIYVRAYETRTDLLRAVIIGAQGTPYHDGLFFFDISLPQDFPNSPPLVHFHSHGHRLNPNLYNNGYLCLSLVNTWTGSREEMWSDKSTLLQLLVSIQGLVLNERPYFNEPGYEHRKVEDQGKNNNSSNNSNNNKNYSRWMLECTRYSENAFVYSCKILLRLVKAPPAGFEDFVAGHFRSRAAALLAEIDKYRGGTVVAGEPCDSSVDRGNSTSFKADLEKIHGMIGEALVELDGNASTAVKEVMKSSI